MLSSRRKFGSPYIITKDGVTVAKEIELEDPYENMGAQLCKEVASKTNDVTGDGTTNCDCACSGNCLRRSEECCSSANPMFIKKNIDKAVAQQSRNSGKLPYLLKARKT